MKFLCDNCKAKYQIADDKVVGKTVRMKCRKCGHQIEVRAAVTETSVSADAPTADAAGHAKAKTGLATSLSAQKPRAPAAPQGARPAGGGGGALAGAFQRNVESEPAPSALTTVMAQATQQTLDPSASDEWYVAINGVPVGPVRLSEIRRKAATGTVTEDSLCWQEGLEEWRPVRSVPELAAIVREAAQGNRVSIVSPPDPRISSIPKPPAPAAPTPARAPEAPQAPRAPEPARPAAAAARNNVVPFQARGERVERIEFEDVPAAKPIGGAAAALAPSIAPNPFAPNANPFAPSTNPFAPAAPVPAEPAPAPAPIAAVADPFAVPPAAAPASAVVDTGSSAAQLDAALASAPVAAIAPAAAPANRVPLWFWPVLIAALVFSGTAAFFIFGRQPPPQQIIVQAPPTVETPKAADTAPADVPPPQAVEPAASASAAVVAKPTAGGAVTAKPTPTAATSEGKKTADLSSLLPGSGGPSTGPGTTGGGSGGGLDSASVQRVVRDRQAGVKRSCWERGGNDQKSSANVTVAVNVAANGTVSGASASGDDPVVAKCIEGQVRSWTFPAPGSPTTVNIPFHFVRQ